MDEDLGFFSLRDEFPPRKPIQEQPCPVSKGFLRNLDEALELQESIAVQGPETKAILATKEGILKIGEKIGITNHTELLRTLVLVLSKTAPDALTKAVDIMANMLTKGARFVKLPKEKQPDEPKPEPNKEAITL